jgi:hypothetical protein
MRRRWVGLGLVMVGALGGACVDRSDRPAGSTSNRGASGRSGPTTVRRSEPVLTETGQHRDSALGFSADGRFVAYLWRNYELGQRVCAERWRCARRLKRDALELRWRPVDAPRKVRRLAVDAMACGPNACKRTLEARLRFGRRRLAVLTAPSVMVVDLPSGNVQRIPAPDGAYGGLAWWSADELVYSVQTGTHLAFFRHRPGSDRRLVHRLPLSSSPHPQHPQPRATTLLRDHFAPDGRAVLFRRAGDSQHALLIMTKAKVVPLGGTVSQLTWRNDGAAVFVEVDRWKAGRRRLLLIDARTGRVTDLTAQQQRTLGARRELTLVSPRWTADDRFVVLYTTSVRSTAEHRGLVIQPHPWKIVLSRQQIIRRSPLPGWVLQQGSSDFHWLSYGSGPTIIRRLRGWPNAWVWASNGRRAARVVDKRVEVFAPRSP